MIQEHLAAPPHLPLSVACALLEVNRGSYYRWQHREPGSKSRGRPQERGGEGVLREQVEALCLRFPGYGRRRIVAQLRRVGEWAPKRRVERLLREAGWGCRVRGRRKREGSGERRPERFPNLLAQQGWRQLSGPDEAWVADLTEVAVGRRACQVALVLDGWSRYVVGWAVGWHPEQALVLAALEQALGAREPGAGWIHHSDQGGAYRSEA